MNVLESMRSKMLAIQECKEVERSQRIDLLIEAAQKRGEDSDRIFWSIVYDLEKAPATTNRRQLSELGFSVICSEEIRGLDSGKVQIVLWELIEALALIQVYLCRTDHLSDRALLEELVYRIIEEPVPDLPLSVGTRDWVDLSSKKGMTLIRRDDQLPRP